MSFKDNTAGTPIMTRKRAHITRTVLELLRGQHGLISPARHRPSQPSSKRSRRLPIHSAKARGPRTSSRLAPLSLPLPEDGTEESKPDSASKATLCVEDNLGRNIGGRKQVVLERKRSSVQKGIRGKRAQPEKSPAEAAVAPAVGLTNYGSNCYANSGIQCLLCVPELNAYFLQEKFQAQIKKENNIEFCNAVTDIYKQIFDVERHPYVSPKAVVALCPLGQNDTHEFLWKQLFPSLQEEAETAGQKKKRSHSSKLARSALHIIKQRSGILDVLFGGEFESKVICKHCRHESVTRDLFFDISLPISGGSLEECLESYFDDEELPLDESYYCSQCRTERAALKRVRVSVSPRYMILHNKKSEYKLIAICVHAGGARRGHFFTYGKRADQVIPMPVVIGSGTRSTTRRCTRSRKASLLNRRPTFCSTQGVISNMNQLYYFE